MHFETKLKQLAQIYPYFPKKDEQPTLTEFLTQTFQAKEVRYYQAQSWQEKTHCEVVFPAPGLQTYCQYTIPLREEVTTYLSKNNEPASPPAENSYIAMYLRYEQNREQIEQLHEIRLDFGNSIPLVITGAQKQVKPSGAKIYTKESEKGKLYASDNGESLYANYQLHSTEPCKTAKDEDEKLLEINLTLKGDGIDGISIKTQNLGNTLLTSFFQDIGYLGLEQLIDKSTL